MLHQALCWAFLGAGCRLCSGFQKPLKAKAAHSSQASRIARSRVDCVSHSFLFQELSRGTWEPHALSPGASIGPLVAWLSLSGFSGRRIDQALWRNTWLWSAAQRGRLGGRRVNAGLLRIVVMSYPP